MKKAVSTLIVATVLFTTQAIMAGSPLIRLQMKEYSNSESPTEIDLRVPLSMLSAMAPQLEEGLSQVNLQDQNIDLRGMWQALRDAGPTQIVAVDGPDGKVEVATTDTHLEVRVDQDEKINVQIPLELVGAFLEGDTMDIEAITAALESMQGQDLININGDNMELRAWVE